MTSQTPYILLTVLPKNPQTFKYKSVLVRNVSKFCSAHLAKRTGSQLFSKLVMFVDVARQRIVVAPRTKGAALVTTTTGMLAG